MIISDNVVKAIFNSNMSTDEKVGALVLLSRKQQDDRSYNREAREAIIEVLNGAMGKPMRAKEIRACLPEIHHTTLYGALRTLTNNGVLKATQVKDGTITVQTREWHGNYWMTSGGWVEVEKEVPNKYNLYTLNF